MARKCAFLRVSKSQHLPTRRRKPVHPLRTECWFDHMVDTPKLHDLLFATLGARVRSLTGSQASLEDFSTPMGDPGLLGPQSVAWRVHAHFTAMLVGGLSSLMVQALHPRALAAVWDHSNFKQNLKARLGRTAYFVAATTYGGRSMALRAIERVNAVHARAVGIDLQGRPYAANEPDLIRWVHLVEVHSFLTAYQHLSHQPLRSAQCDGYIAEMRQIGHLLGALHLPASWRDTEQALLAYEGELVCDARTRETVQVIENYPVEMLDKPFMHGVMQAAFDTMPSWALQRLGRPPSCELARRARRAALQLATIPVQWMLDQQGVAATARQRLSASR